jgi:3',5'-nucleoside bisphosphate phosphatase
VIDLHLHTTASDGRSSPEQLVQAARRAGVRVLSVTDHDTVAGLDPVAAGCAEAGIEWVPGVEITSTREQVDVHVLGYFIDHHSPVLTSFLASQASDRVRRVREMIDKLRALGIDLDADMLLAAPDRSGGGWVGRPLLARALVRQHAVRSTREAFDTYLAEGGAAWVPRRAPDPADVIALIHRARGIASLAHPGLTGHDEWIPSMAAAGLDALEVYYAEHSPQLTTHYRILAERLGLEMSGGSDYHGDPAYGPARPGSVSLPDQAFEGLRLKLQQVRRAGHGDGVVGGMD